MDEPARYREVVEAAGRLSLAEYGQEHEESESLSAAGFHYFQGYYFTEPRIESGKRLPQKASCACAFSDRV